MSVDDGQDENFHLKSPTGPRVTPPRQPSPWQAPPWQAPPPQQAPRPPDHPPLTALRAFKPSFWSVVIFTLLLSGVGIRAYRDLSSPGAWDYWRETYVTASMTSTIIPDADIERTGRGRRALAISGEIGAASANWLRDKLDEAKLAPGDAVLLSSRGGSLNQAAIMGEIIRSRGLSTAVGTADPGGRVSPARCASACVLVFAGGKTRYGVEDSLLGVHRFTATSQVSDPIAEAQRISGMVLHYMTKMGVSSTVVEAMSQTADIRWLSPKEAVAMNLITTPIGSSLSRR